MMGGTSNITNTTRHNGGHANEDDHLYHGHDYDKALVNQIVSPILLFLGLFGNIMLIKMMVFTRTVSSQPLANNVIAQSVSDSLLLLSSLVPKWLEAIILHEHIRRNGIMCKVAMSITIANFMMSSWFLVVLTVSRALAVWKPHHFQKLLSRKVSNAAIIAVVVLSATFAFLMTKYYSNPSDCSLGGIAFYSLNREGSRLSGALIFVIPIALMVGSNFLMIKHIIKVSHATDNLNAEITLQTSSPGPGSAMGRKKKQSVFAKQKKASRPGSGTSNNRKKKQNVFARLRKRPQIFTAVVISVVFSISLGPIYLTEVLHGLEIVRLESEDLATVLSQIVYMNAAIKYYLNVLTSQHLRSKIKRFFWKKMAQYKLANVSLSQMRRSTLTSIFHSAQETQPTKELSAPLTTGGSHNASLTEPGMSFSGMELRESAPGSDTGRGIREDIKGTEDTQSSLVRQHVDGLSQSFSATTKTETARAVNDHDHTEQVQPTTTTTTTTASTTMITAITTSMTTTMGCSSVDSDDYLPLSSTSLGDVSLAAGLFQDSTLTTSTDSNNDQISPPPRSLFSLIRKYM